VLAPTAAGTVLDLDDVFHQLVRFCFSFSGRFLLVLNLLFAAWQWLPLWYLWPK
jgi:hypothetical protein